MSAATPQVEPGRAAEARTGSGTSSAGGVGDRLRDVASASLRGLGKAVASRRFGALLSPSGMHVAEYRQTRGGVEVVQYVHEGFDAAKPADTAQRLADLAESIGARRGRLALAISGFGSCHHILALPAAEPEVLKPIVDREMRRFYPDLNDPVIEVDWERRRFYPDLDDPVIEFVVSGSTEDREAPKEELLVGAVPKRLARQLHGALDARGIELDHLTIFPRVVQALFDQLADERTPAVLLILLESVSLVGCFYEGVLRLFSEPTTTPAAGRARDWSRVVEHLERGVLFLRQQFPASSAEQVLLAASREDYEELEETIRTALSMRVRRFGPTGVPPGALAALGAALVAQGEGELNLLPVELRPASFTERWTRRLALAGAATLMLSGALWAWQGVDGARTMALALDAAETALEGRASAISGIEDVMVERRAHAERVELLTAADGERARVQGILEEIARTVAPSLRLTRLAARTSGSGWDVSLHGRSESVSAAGAHRAIDRLYRGIAQRLPLDGSVQLESLQTVRGLESGAAGVAIGFELSFIVSNEWNLQR